MLGEAANTEGKTLPRATNCSTEGLEATTRRPTAPREDGSNLMQK